MYSLYKTVNTINDKIYYGVHNENCKGRGIYVGSGRDLLKDVRKYGKDKFTRIIIALYSTSEEAYAAEKELVTKEVVADTSTYNLMVGGYCPPNKLGVTLSEDHKLNISNGLLASNYIHSTETRDKISIAQKGRPGRKKETAEIEKIRTALLNRKRSKSTAKKISDSLSRKVNQIDPITEEVIKIWSSSKLAVKELNLRGGNGGISAVCLGRQITSGGFKWAYLTKEPV